MLSRAFVTDYYQKMMLSKNQRKSLIEFYSDKSEITYKGTRYRGLKEIAEKI
jgi:hypothetical protein